jgi:hypothetical protein
MFAGGARWNERVESGLENFGRVSPLHWFFVLVLVLGKFGVCVRAAVGNLGGLGIKHRGDIHDWTPQCPPYV